MVTRKDALALMAEKLAAKDCKDTDPEHFFDYTMQFKTGFTAAVELLLPVVEAQDDFNKYFSPGDNWYPPFAKVIADLDAKLADVRGAE